jgi:outer membrane receptor protein involved in Fe transport
MRVTNTSYISLSHSISENTFYELKLDRHYSRRHWNVKEDGMFDSLWVPLPSGDSVFVTQPEGGDGIDDFADEDNDKLVEINGVESAWYWTDPKLPYDFTRDQDDQNFYTSGYHRLAWEERNAETWTVKGNITSQIARNHLIKSGFEWTTNSLLQYSADMASGGNLYITDPYHSYPYSIALHTADKMEFEGMILNAGLRLDYFSSNWPHFPSDPFHPVPDSLINEGGVIHNPTTPKAKYQITPRLGFSYPITDMDKLHFSYGHYFQMPPLVFLYRNPWYNLSGAFPLIGNSDLEAEKTISYEFGVEHAFTHYAMADITAFYKDITDLLETEQIYYTAAAYYTRYTNADFARVRGFEIALKLRPGGRFRYLSGSMNYTFSIASGKSSSTRQNYDYIWAGWIVPKKEFPLDWDERHRVSLNVAFTVSKDEHFFGNKFLTDFGISTLTNFGSGLPWTPSSSTREQRINEARLPWNLITDMKLSKNLYLGKLKLALFANINNLFDKTDNIRTLTDPAWYEAELAKAGLKEDEIISGSGYRKEKAKAAKGLWNDPFALYTRRHVDVGIEFGF